MQFVITQTSVCCRSYGDLRGEKKALRIEVRQQTLGPWITDTLSTELRPLNPPGQTLSHKSQEGKNWEPNFP